MNHLIRTWNGRIIRHRQDGYLSATDMAQACNKLWGNWYRLDSTKEYLEVLKKRRYSDLNNGTLVDIVQGGVADLQGTWVYRKVAIRFAQWLNAEFAVQVDEWIDELLEKGSVNLQPQSLAETILMIGQQMVENERRQKEFEARLAEYDKRRLEAEEDMKAIPEPTRDAPEITIRMQISRLVRDYSVNKGCSFSQVWAMVYRDFRDRYHVDLQQRSQNTSGKKKPLDICEQLGLLEQLYASASALLR